jgi:hypothetical protein
MKPNVFSLLAILNTFLKMTNSYSLFFTTEYEIVMTGMILGSISVGIERYQK